LGVCSSIMREHLAGAQHSFAHLKVGEAVLKCGEGRVHSLRVVPSPGRSLAPATISGKRCLRT
jgi:hypothetical protein